MPVLANEAQRYGNEKRFFGGLRGRAAAALAQFERERARRHVVLRAGAQARGACLAIPALKRCEVRCESRIGVGVGNGLREVVAGYGLTVEALEVQRHALCEAGFSNEGLHHTNNFGPFLVNGDGVEVVNFFVLVRTDGMGHWACVLRELGCAQNTDVINAFHGAPRCTASHVLAELLVAEYG